MSAFVSDANIQGRVRVRTWGDLHVRSLFKGFMVIVEAANPAFLNLLYPSSISLQYFVFAPGVPVGPIRDSLMSDDTIAAGKWSSFNVNDTKAFLNVTRVRRMRAQHRRGAADS